MEFFILNFGSHSNIDGSLIKRPPKGKKCCLQQLERTDEAGEVPLPSPPKLLLCGDGLLHTGAVYPAAKVLKS